MDCRTNGNQISIMLGSRDWNVTAGNAGQVVCSVATHYEKYGYVIKHISKDDVHTVLLEKSGLFKAVPGLKTQVMITLTFRENTPFKVELLFHTPAGFGALLMARFPINETIVPGYHPIVVLPRNNQIICPFIYKPFIERNTGIAVSRHISDNIFWVVEQALVDM